MIMMIGQPQWESFRYLHRYVILVCFWRYLGEYMKDWEKAYWYGAVIGILTTLVVVALWPHAACAQVPNWDNSPYNWKNSELNYDNSSTKWDNSVYNWKNSEYNYNSNTRVYTNGGDNMGYATISPSGTANYFDNDGNRKGYRGE